MIVGILIWTYLIGGIVAGIVLRVRAGVGVMCRLKILGPDGFGLGWTVHSAVKMMGWPVVLGMWLANGRPEPRVVFNEKAVQRQTSQNLGNARM